MRVTEAAALAAGRWIGHGDKIAADGAAVDAMRLMIDTVSMHGTVVIGEGEKDEAPMLYNGEEVGDGTGPGVDVAVDPVDGTRLTALGQPNALAVIALAERGSMFFPGAAVYMEKVAAGPEAADAIDITASPAENVRRVAKAKGVRPEEITVTILDRERHAGLITEVREVGARVFLITDGDVAAAMAPATSPSVIKNTRAPTSRTSVIKPAWRSRSRIVTVISSGRTPFAFATRRTFSAGDAVMSIASAASGPAATFSM